LKVISEHFLKLRNYLESVGNPAETFGNAKGTLLEQYLTLSKPSSSHIVTEQTPASSKAEWLSMQLKAMRRRAQYQAQCLVLQGQAEVIALLCKSLWEVVKPIVEDPDNPQPGHAPHVGLELERLDAACSLSLSSFVLVLSL
jgi:hypothetical protein